MCAPVSLPFEHIVSQLGQLPLDAEYEYLDDVGSLALDENRLVAHFEELQRRRAAPIVDVEDSAPVKGLSRTVPSVTPTDGVTVEPLTGADKPQYWRDEYLEHAFTKLELAGCSRQFKQRSRRSRALAHSGDHRERIARLETALRLLGPGDVSAPAGVTETMPRERSGGMSSSSRFQDRLSVPLVSAAGYQLDEAGASALIALDQQLGTLTIAGRLSGIELSLRRFDLAYDRACDEDRTIDLSIALESALLSGDRDGLRYRIGLRGAAPLNATDSPKTVQAELQRLYDVRSAVVHNGELLQNLRAKSKYFGSRRPHEFAQAIWRLVRLIIREYPRRLAGGEKLKDINAALDTRIVEALGITPGLTTTGFGGGDETIAAPHQG